MERARSLICAALVGSIVGCAPTDSQVAWNESVDPPVTMSGAGAAMEWRSLAYRNEHGQIPEGAWRTASEQFLANQRAQLSSGGYGTFFPAAQGYQWKERGPANVSGRLRAMVIDPNDDSRIWAGSVAGGVWFSHDFGMSWENLFDDEPNQAVGAMAMDPVDSNVIYAGTGEGYFSAASRHGEGILVTRDGGLNWETMPATASWAYVNRIEIAHDDRDRMIAATSSPGGIWLSTDRGGSWTRVLYVNTGFDVEFDPTDSSKVLVTALENDLTTQAVYRSTDGGATWTRAGGSLDAIDGWLRRIEVAIAPSFPDYVYASVAGYGEPSTVHRSMDGGLTWIEVEPSGGHSPDGTWYCNTIEVHPTDHRRLAVGGVWSYTSTNGGETFWESFSSRTGVHVDFHQFLMRPAHDKDLNPAVYMLTDGGVFMTRAFWGTAYGAPTRGNLDIGQITTQFYAVDGYGPTDYLVGGMQDNGTDALLGSSRRASGLVGGDGGFAEIDAQNPRNVLVTTQNGRVYIGSPTGSFTRISDPIEDAGGSRAQVNFIAPMVQADSDGDTVFLGARRLWRTQDARSAEQPAWKIVRTGDANTSAIAVASRDSRVVYTGQNDGKIYRTLNGRDAEPTWEVIDDNGAKNPLPDRYVTRIVVHPRHSSRLFAMFGGFQADNLWKSKDFGETWERVTGSGQFVLPNAPVRGLAWDSRNSLHLHVATEVGVYHSFDGGQTWKASLSGPKHVSIDDIRFMHHSHRLVAATFGRGLWTLETGDFEPGVIWRKKDGDLQAWPLLGGDVDQAYPIDLPPNSSVQRADLNGDGWDDLIVYDPATQRHFALQLRGGQVVAETTLKTGSAWIVDTVADMDRDGRDDLFWRRPSDDTIVLWLMNGHAAKLQTSFGPRPSAEISLYMDNDTRSWTNVVLSYPNGRRHRWEMIGASRWDDKWFYASPDSIDYSLKNIQTSAVTRIAHVPSTGEFQALGTWMGWGDVLRLWGRFPNREVIGIADLDRDDMDDMVLYDMTDGRIHVWLVQDAKYRKATGSPGVAPDSKVVMNDFDDDGIDDLFIWNQVTGEVSLWFMDGIEAREKRSLGTMSPETYDDVMVGSW